MFHFTEKNLTSGETRDFNRPLFPAKDKAVLAQFIENAHALNQTAFVKNWKGKKVSIHMANNGQITNQSIIPPDEEIAAFLHRFRPFYLNNEATNFNKVANMVSSHFDDVWITDLTRLCKRCYDGRTSREKFEIAVKGMIINSQVFLDHYLNSLEYHHDPNRRKHIDVIAETFPLDVQKPFVVLLLIGRVEAINKLTSFLGTCFAREDGRTITLQSD
jgi:hypothetical protein